MNNLSISQAKQHSVKQDVPDANHERALSIMSAVHSPIKSSQLEESARKLHPGDLMRTLSTSNDIPTKPLSTTEQDVSWKYGVSAKDNVIHESPKTSNKPLFDKMSRPFRSMRGKSSTQGNNLSTNMLVITTDDALPVRPYPRSTYSELNVDVDDDNGDMGSIGSDGVSIHSSYSMPMDDELALDAGLQASLEDNGENEEKGDGEFDAVNHDLQLDYAPQGSPATRFRFVVGGQPNVATEMGSGIHEESRGAWMNLSAEDRVTIVEAIGERNNREDQHLPRESLIDSGCNVGTSGPGMSFSGYSEPAQYVNVTGIGGSTSSARLGSFRSVVSLDSGEKVILIFRGYAHHTESSSATHSVDQIESNGNTIQGRSPRHGEASLIETPGGEIIPLQLMDDWQSEPHQQQQNYSERNYFLNAP